MHVHERLKRYCVKAARTAWREFRKYRAAGDDFGAYLAYREMRSHLEAARAIEADRKREEVGDGCSW